MHVKGNTRSPAPAPHSPAQLWDRLSAAEFTSAAQELNYSQVDGSQMGHPQMSDKLHLTD